MRTSFWTRRTSIGTAAALVTAAMVMAPSIPARQIPKDCSVLVLYNAKVLTMDQRNTIASSVIIEDEHIAEVSTSRGVPKHNGCAKLVDLHGRTVIPGLIENHDHFLTLGLRPGHDTRLETASSISEVLELIRARTKTIRTGDWITAIGGWSPIQLQEKRLPTLAELDAVAPNNPVFLYVGFAGPSKTNTLGRKFFEGENVPVSDGGTIASESSSIAALNKLREIQSFDDQKRATTDAMRYSASLGLTMHDDQAGTWPDINLEPGAVFGTGPIWHGLVQESDASLSLDPFSGYNAILALHRANKMLVRIRLFLSTSDLRPGLPFLNQRLNNQFRNFGDNWIKISGLGEHISGGDFGVPPNYYETAVRLVAEKGWSYNQHGDTENQRAITEIWGRVNTSIPLGGLRWCLAHVPGIDEETLNRLKAIGVGVSGGGTPYLAEGAVPASPFRLLLDSGIHAGYGGDGANIAPLNPWIHIYFMVTGKNAAGLVIIPRGQTITRLEALRLYTIENAWFTKDENILGSIEIGKLADLAVLSNDFSDPVRVPDESIKRLSSVLTIVGGKIVHGSLALGRTRKTKL